MVRAIRDLQHVFHWRGRERRLRQCRMTVEALEKRTVALSYEARARGLARRANLGADNSNGGQRRACGATDIRGDQAALDGLITQPPSLDFTRNDDTLELHRQRNNP